MTTTIPHKTSPRKPGLDVLKCIAAFFVVCIHCGPYSPNGTSAADIASLGLYALLNLAVPTFFLITGYYYPDMLRKGKVNRQIRKILQIAIGAGLLYLPYALGAHLLKGDASIWLAETFSPHRLKAWIFLNEPFVSVPLWYLWAILYVLIIMQTLDRFGWWKRAIPIMGG